MEFWPSLLLTRAAYKAFKQQQPEVFTRVLRNAVCGAVLVAPEALAVNLQTLYLVGRHFAGKGGGGRAVGGGG
jgi:hypothetical protein